MKIENNEIIADEGHVVSQVNKDNYFSRGPIFSQETLKSFKEITIEEYKKIVEKQRLEEAEKYGLPLE